MQPQPEQITSSSRLANPQFAQFLIFPIFNPFLVLLQDTASDAENYFLQM
jgi:hypothetical protein